jgi:hypothetical protein
MARFPEDFMFVLNNQDLLGMRSQFVTASGTPMIIRSCFFKVAICDLKEGAG